MKLFYLLPLLLLCTTNVKAEENSVKLNIPYSWIITVKPDSCIKDSDCISKFENQSRAVTSFNSAIKVDLSPIYISFAVLEKSEDKFTIKANLAIPDENLNYDIEQSGKYSEIIQISESDSNVSIDFRFIVNKLK